ncbi:MAG TPA: phage tail protein [Allosphingosinicella sp.]|jgi:hypothetical protein
MATLVLSTAGQIIGGPVGGAIGATIGQQIDMRIFAPKARHGPRLGDLAVQTSSYGSQIAKIFGTIRVAGTVIWSTDLKEQKEKKGGGKGQPKTVNYSYSASFAVALSGRQVAEVRRIWADGKLLRGAAGDFKSELGAFRLHGGSEDQAADPLIAAAEGAGGTPAYRGIAYAVFEDLQLADFGNRIPSLSFELVAEEEASLLAVAEALSGGEVTADAAVPLVGYAASGDSVRSAIEALGDVLPLRVADDGTRLRLAGGVGAVLLPAGGDAFGPDGAGGRMEVERGAASAVAAEVSVAFYDPARDFQTGLQRASTGEAGLRAERRVLPAAVSADVAKACAEQRLAEAWAARRQIKAHHGWALAGLRPGSDVRVPGHPGRWRLTRWSLEKMVVTLGLVGAPAAAPAAAAAAPGRPVGQEDLVHGPTTLQLLDLPLTENDEVALRPRLLAAAAGAEAGWRSAALAVSFDGGARWQAAGGTASAATMGTLVAPAPPRGSALTDMETRLTVELLHDGMWLESRNDLALAGGANMAAIGDELLQFGDAEQIGPRLFRLSRLLRGRRGTEWAAAHGAGERFVLIEPESLAALEVPAAAIGGEARLLATGLGDGEAGAEASAMVTGEALRPPSPVHLRAERGAGGDVLLSWVRRSRGGWNWPSGADTPLAEERERYRVTIAGAFGVRSAEVPEAAFTYPAALQAADGASGLVEIEVIQLGTHAASRSASTIVDLGGN